MSQDGKSTAARVARIEGHMRVLQPAFRLSSRDHASILAAVFIMLGGPDGMDTVMERLEWVEGYLEAKLSLGGE